MVYRCLICLSAVVGSVASLEFLWSFTDFALAFCVYLYVHITEMP
ncbi:MAG: hypothetical protein ACLSEX_05760 [Blautia sp.]